MSQSRAVCRRMMRILIREGADLWVSGFFFKAVVQEVLLFGSYTWMFIPLRRRVVGGFQYQVALQLTGRLLQKKTDRKW